MNWFNSADATTPAPAAAEAAPARPAIASWRVVAAVILCTVGIAVSGLLLLQHHGQSSAVAAVEQLCGAGAHSGCAVVASSRWSAVGGIPLAAIGLVFYAAVALLIVDIGWWMLTGPQGRELLVAILVAAACGYAGFRTWRDQQTYV